MTGAKKLRSMKFKSNWPLTNGCLRTHFHRFGANFVDRWPRWTGARLIKVHLHSKSFGGIEVAAYGRVTLNRGGRNSRFDCTALEGSVKYFTGGLKPVSWGANCTLYSDVDQDT